MHKVNFITWSVDVRSDERVIACAAVATVDGWLMKWMKWEGERN